MSHYTMHLLNTSPHIRKVASVLLAASVKKTFPETCLVGGGVTPLGFYYDFAFPFAFHESFLVLLEEGIAGLIKSSSHIKQMEMVPFSASQMLVFHKEPFRAEDAALSNSSLVFVFQIDQFVDWMEDGLEGLSTRDAGAVKLKSFEKIGMRDGRGIVRIWGAACSDRQSLKKFLKEETHLVSRLHPQIGAQLDLFSALTVHEGLWLWHPRGEALWDDLSRFLRQKLIEEKFSFIKLPGPISLSLSEGEELSSFAERELARRASLIAGSSFSKVSEEVCFYDSLLQDFSCGLLKTRESSLDIQYIFCSPSQLLDESISSLLFIIKILKILSFEFKLVLSVRKVKPSALTRGEKICAEALRKAASSATEGVFEETTHAEFKGVKIDFKITDALGREWSTAFLQSFFIEDKSSQVTLEFSSLGSRERLIALMLEKHEGIPSLFMAGESFNSKAGVAK